MYVNDFLLFFDEKRHSYPMYLEIYYSKTMDWCISIYKKGCGEKGEDLRILDVQHCDMQLCFAKAQVELKEWLLDNEGGY